MAGNRWIPDFLEDGVLSCFDAVAEIFRLQAEGKITEAEGQIAIAEAVKDDSGIWEWLKNAWDYELVEQDPDKKSKSLLPDWMSPSAITLEEDEEEGEGEEGRTPLEVEEITEE